MKKTIIKKGFSVIELLVAISLFVTLSAVLIQSVVQSLGTSQKVGAESAVRDNLNFAGDVVVRNLRNAKSITSACNGVSSNTITYQDQNSVAGSFTCVTGQSPYLGSGSTNARLTSDDIILTTCRITCTQSGTTLPPTVELVLGGRLVTSESRLESSLEVIKRVTLRTY